MPSKISSSLVRIVLDPSKVIIVAKTAVPPLIVIVGLVGVGTIAVVATMVGVGITVGVTIWSE